MVTLCVVLQLSLTLSIISTLGVLVFSTVLGWVVDVLVLQLKMFSDHTILQTSAVLFCVSTLRL